MKLSFRTIEALDAVSRVSPSLLIRGRKVLVFNRDTGTRAEAEIDAPFPHPVAFQDITELLAPLIQLGASQAELEFGADGCTIVAPDGSRSTVATSRTLLSELLQRAGASRRGRSSRLHSFVLTHTTLHVWQSATSLAKGKNTFQTVVGSDGKTAFLVLQRAPHAASPEGGFGSFRTPIGKCRNSFVFELSPSAFSCLPSDDYEAVVTTRARHGELSVTSRTRPISYTFELSVSTVETAPSTKRRKT